MKRVDWDIVKENIGWGLLGVILLILVLLVVSSIGIGIYFMWDWLNTHAIHDGMLSAIPFAAFPILVVGIGLVMQLTDNTSKLSRSRQQRRSNKVSTGKDSIPEWN